MRTVQPEFVSLNGSDNVGKTTQLRLLAQRCSGFQPLGAIHDHDPEPWARVAAGDYAQWWFETSTTVELTAMLLASHAKRTAAREEGHTDCSTGACPCSWQWPQQPAWSRTG